jgi:hypothetical protein
MRPEVDKENSAEVDALRESLKQKSEQVVDLHKTKAEIERLKREQEELKEKLTLEKELELTKRLKAEKESHRQSLEAEKEKFRLEYEEENNLKLAEYKKKMDDQTALIAEMKRKSEQGSMQLQGEVQELAIEDILRAAFPFDAIAEVPKGIKGADVIQTVRNKAGADAGVIAYESKRTKAFGADWIGKLKSDAALVKADLCILVTEALPEGIERVGQREGVWVCTFSEFKSVALILRDSLLRISDAYGSQTNKGEKMQMLYDYLTGKEFMAQFSAIIEGFSDLKKGYDDERMRMEMIWKKREKQLEKVMLNANGFIGSIQGIAGSSLPDLVLLEDKAAPLLGR